MPIYIAINDSVQHDFVFLKREYIHLNVRYEVPHFVLKLPFVYASEDPPCRKNNLQT